MQSYRIKQTAYGRTSDNAFTQEDGWPIQFSMIKNGKTNLPRQFLISNILPELKDDTTEICVDQRTKDTR